MSTLGDDEDSESIWKRLEPILDEAMGRLSALDRDAILMRFFQKQDFRSVAAALKVSEDAAQKRVSRALEKLRVFLQRRGVTVSATALLGALTVQSVTAPPTALAAAVAGTALAGTAATGAILLSGFEKVLVMTKLKTIAAGAIALAAVTTPLVMQYQSIRQLRDENRALREAQIQEPPAPKVATRAIDTDEAEHRELLQLRGEIARLRREQTRLAKLEEENKGLRTQTKAAPKPPELRVSSESWADTGFGSPLAALQTAHWAVRTGNIEKFKESLFITDDARRVLNTALETMAAGAPPEALEEVKKRGWGVEEGIMFPMMAQDRKLGYKGYEILSQSSPQPDEVQLEVQLEMNSAPAQTKNLRFKQFGDAWKQVLDVQDLDLPAEVKRKALAGQ